IAIAAAFDPVVVLSGRVRARLAVVDASRSAEAERVLEALARDLGDSFEIVRAITSDAAAAIVIGDAYEPSRITTPPPSGFAGMISTVTLPPDDVVIASAIAPRAVPPATSIHVESDVDGPRVPGATTDLVARIDGLEIARVAHRWTRASERWRAALDV